MSALDLEKAEPHFEVGALGLQSCFLKTSFKIDFSLRLAASDFACHSYLYYIENFFELDFTSDAFLV